MTTIIEFFSRSMQIIRPTSTWLSTMLDKTTLVCHLSCCWIFMFVCVGISSVSRGCYPVASYTPGCTNTDTAGVMSSQCICASNSCNSPPGSGAGWPSGSGVGVGSGGQSGGSGFTCYSCTDCNDPFSASGVSTCYATQACHKIKASISSGGRK